jgi:flavin-dependent dehydrogenase
MSPRQIVIVGAGPAGLAAARAYREHGGAAEITLLAHELIAAGESPS